MQGVGESREELREGCGGAAGVQGRVAGDLRECCRSAGECRGELRRGELRECRGELREAYGRAVRRRVVAKFAQIQGSNWCCFLLLAVRLCQRPPRQQLVLLPLAASPCSQHGFPQQSYSDG